MTEPEEWKSIKIRESTYEDLKRMGKGISKAVEILVEEQKSRIESRIEDIKDIGEDIAGILLEHGVFDIRFSGGTILDIEEDGDILRIKGCIGLRVPNAEARAKIIEVLKGKEEPENE